MMDYELDVGLFVLSSGHRKYISYFYFFEAIHLVYVDVICVGLFRCRSVFGLCYFILWFIMLLCIFIYVIWTICSGNIEMVQSSG